jgi:hypothetical protein
MFWKKLIGLFSLNVPAPGKIPLLTPGKTPPFDTGENTPLIPGKIHLQIKYFTHHFTG